MKKFFFLAVAAVIALAACTKNNADTTAYQQGKVINFNTVANKATKAPITGTYYTHDLAPFGVFAYYLASGDWSTSSDNTSAASYMNDVEVRFNTSKYIWAPHDGTTFVNYYWPLQGKLTFIAYSPKAAADAEFSTEGELTLKNFEVNTTVASQVDLLYSALNANKTQNESIYTDGSGTANSNTVANGGSGEGDMGVNIKFKHALSQIIFKAQAATEVYDAGMSFKINNITVNAAKTADEMSVTNPTDVQLASAITTWTNPKTMTDFEVRGADFPNDTEATGSANFLGKTLSAAIGDPLLMIPTDFGTTTGLSNPSVTIEYTLYRMSPVLNMGKKSVTIYFDDIEDNISQWQAGMKYEYDLTIDLQKIYFNPTITADWATGGADDIDVPDDARP